jgi:hypothetical protein
VTLMTEEINHSRDGEKFSPEQLQRCPRLVDLRRRQQPAVGRRQREQLPTDPNPGRLAIDVHYYDPFNFTLMTTDESWGYYPFFWGQGYHGRAAFPTVTPPAQVYLCRYSRREEARKKSLEFRHWYLRSLFYRHPVSCFQGGLPAPRVGTVSKRRRLEYR